MKSTSLAFFVSAAVAAALTVSCGAPAKCDAKNCAGGCCDAQDKCQLGGSSPQACGFNGVTCAVCVFGQSCSLGQCVSMTSGTGGGSGTVGGGSATTGGGSSTGGGSATGGGAASSGGGTADGGGTASTGGGSATGGGTTSSGGGSASSGGGTSSTGGGSASSGGGTASTGGGSASSGGGTASTGGGTAATGGGSAVRDTTLAQVRQATMCTEKVRVSGVVVTAIESSTVVGADTRVNFWVADPTNPQAAIYVFKETTDQPSTYNPTVGDIITIEGYFMPAKSFLDRTGYRGELRSGCASGCGCTSAQALAMTITPIGTRAPLADNTVPTGFGAGLQANNDYLGARVFIPGPLTLSNANPPEFRRISAVPNDTVYFGFSVTGTAVPAGILVNNFKTFGTGVGRCDYRAFANDGGTVTFPNGIRGVWDTYTHAPCTDGGTSGTCFRGNGIVPGTAALTTNVIYPLDCTTDLVGMVQ